MRAVLARLALATTALAAAALPASLEAQIVYSGVLTRTIPRSGSFYQNVANGTFYTGPATFPSCPGAGCNYDFNIFGSLSTFSPPSGAGETSPTPPAQRGFVAATTTGLPLALPVGTLIGSTSTFNSGGAGTGNFLGAGPQLLGFRFRNEEGGANTLHYGWARISLPTTGDGVLLDFAYDATPGAAIAAGDVGGAASTVPEPGTYALFGTGLAGLAVMRRRRRA